MNAILSGAGAMKLGPTAQAESYLNVFVSSLLKSIAGATFHSSKSDTDGTGSFIYPSVCLSVCRIVVKFCVCKKIAKVQM